MHRHQVEEHPQPCIVVPWGELDTGKLTKYAVEEFSTANGPADYARFVADIIGAKKLSMGPQNVMEQSQRCSEGVERGVEIGRELCRASRESKSA